MVCKIEVIGGPAAVKNAKKILSIFQWKSDGEMVVDDLVPRLLKTLGYTLVERRWNPYQFGETSCYKFHGEKLPSFQEQLIFARIWVIATFAQNKSYMRKKLDKLNKLEDEYMA